ncbi:ketopantoate reductase family protein [Heliorestis acidaminivorans]|uniref:2-dehydropantoate 2-reductase n=1 Tax=Heliorestis acidaminivorans TaxID=553427 RepID=A0A6I0F1Z4_9FIRM|nr:ketopantoate reductase family protein [Heliorestis acidaminivorans]KAB2953338.1 ketopantoate reductase family protein [Heliorestis acidaminivorans]
MNVLIYGLGALGTVYATFLQNKGHNVTAFVRPKALPTLQTEGLKVTGIWGDHKTKKCTFITELSELQDSPDLVIVTVKSFDTEETARQIEPLLSKKSYVLLAQNGFGNYEQAVKYIPRDQLILARVIFGAETLALGQSKVTVIADDVIIGSPTEQVPLHILEEIAKTFCEANIPTGSSRDVMKYIWSKIIYNSALNSLGAILEVNYGTLAELDHSRQIMNHIIAEIFSLLDAMGQKTLWPDQEAYLKAFYDQLVPITASHHPSMLQDIQRGRRTEIDALNGAVVALGKKYAVATPVNEVIAKLVKAKETKLMKKPNMRKP